MSSKHRYLLNRDGRYFARIVIPKPLRAFLGNKSELREPLGPDRRTAIARLADAIVLHDPKPLEEIDHALQEFRGAVANFERVKAGFIAYNAAKVTA